MFRGTVIIELDSADAPSAKSRLEQALADGVGILGKGETFEIRDLRQVREKGERWDKNIPFAKDVRAGTKECHVGTFRVKYNSAEGAQKDQRWSVHDGDGQVVEQHSQYWDAVMGARKLASGRATVAA